MFLKIRYITSYCYVISLDNYLSLNNLKKKKIITNYNFNFRILFINNCNYYYYYCNIVYRIRDKLILYDNKF